MTGSRGGRALVVNDDPSLISEYQQILCGRGAGNGQAPFETEPVFGGVDHLLFGAAIEHPDFPAVEVAAYRGGEAAVAAAHRAVNDDRSFLVAFIDLELRSGIDGLETAERIRAADDRIQIALVAGYDSFHPIEFAARVPPADRLSYVRKPFHPYEIQHLVISALQRREVEAQVPVWQRVQARDDHPLKLHDILSRIPAGALVFDPRGRLVAANKAMHRLCVNGAICLAPGTSYQSIRQVMCADGTDTWCAADGTRITTNDGHRWALITESVAASGETTCLVCDVTELKHLDAARWRLNGLANVTRSFAGLCDTIDRLYASPAAADAIDPLLSRLRLLSRQRHLTTQVVDLSQYMGRAVRRIRRRLPAGIGFEVVVDAGLWPVEVDPDGFARALAELAANACDAMTGGGRIIVEAANVRVAAGADVLALGLAAGNFVRISVQDTGCGISPDIAHQALIPFQSQSDDRHFGLGLAIVHAFAISSGGALEIQGSSGSGASIRLYLPKAASQANSVATGANGRRPALDRFPTGNPARNDPPDSSNRGQIT